MTRAILGKRNIRELASPAIRAALPSNSQSTNPPVFSVSAEHGSGARQAQAPCPLGAVWGILHGTQPENERVT